MNFRVCGNVNWSRRRSTVNYGNRISPPPSLSALRLFPPSCPPYFPPFLCASLFPYRVTWPPGGCLPTRHTQVLLSGAPSNRLLGSLMLNYHFSLLLQKRKRKSFFFFFSNESVLFLFCFFSAGFSTCRVHVGGNATIGFEKGM